MYFIGWKKKARKQLDKIADISIKSEIISAVTTLADLPSAKQVKKLTNHRYGYRLRVGRYRVFFEVAETIQVVSIEEVKKRDDRTY
jgi:mRNA-degrading endonuclease RelE of RelBE toxin-antitoxin system